MRTWREVRNFTSQKFRLTPDSVPPQLPTSRAWRSAHISEVAGVTFSDSDSAPVPKFFNPGPAILQIWESNSCSDSGYNHPSNHYLPITTAQTPATAELEKWLRIRVRFFTNFWLWVRTRSERKTQNAGGVDSGTPGPVSSEISDFTPCTHAQSDILHTKYAHKTYY